MNFIFLAQEVFARSFYRALKDLNYKKIYIINRSNKKFNLWPDKNKINKIKNFPKKNPNKNVIINATPIGMKQIKKRIFYLN